MSVQTCIIFHGIVYVLMWFLIAVVLFVYTR